MNNFIKEIEKIEDGALLKSSDIMKIPVVKKMKVFPYPKAIYRCLKSGILKSSINTSSGSKQSSYLISGKEIKKFLKSRIVI